MDAISYSYADKQAKRIKKFINDPDSTSGVLTVPKVIASGESVTIPAGRVAILPDVQVDGTLNVVGDVFIPTGTANSKVVQKVVSTDNAVVRFDGVTGDVQNSGVIIDDNNNVGIGISSPSSTLHITKGVLSSVGPELRLHNNYDSSALGHATNIVLKTGVGTTDGKQWNIGTVSTAIYGGLPALTFKCADLDATTPVEKMRIDSAGNVGIGVTPSAWVSGFNAIEGNSGSIVYRSSNSGLELWQNAYFSAGTNTYKATAAASRYAQQSGQHIWYTAPSGTAGNAITWTNAMTLGSNGNLLLGTSTDDGVDKLQVNGSISVSSIKTDGYFEIGKDYPFGDYTGIQYTKNPASMLVMIGGNNSDGAGRSALYLVNLRVRSGNASTSAIRIAGDTGISATFSYVEPNIFRVTNTSSDAAYNWRYIGGYN